MKQQLIITELTHFFAVAVLLYESEAAETVECRNVDPGGSYSWTLSPDHTEGARMALAASSDRYTIDGRSLVIELNITGVGVAPRD